MQRFVMLYWRAKPNQQLLPDMNADTEQCITSLSSRYNTRRLGQSNHTSQYCSTVRSESRCALRLRYVDLVASIKVAVEACCCFTVFSC
jgi:hypothetical protein